jgi:hypothetical protein
MQTEARFLLFIVSYAGNPPLYCLQSNGVRLIGENKADMAAGPLKIPVKFVIVIDPYGCLFEKANIQSGSGMGRNSLKLSLRTELNASKVGSILFFAFISAPK